MINKELIVDSSKSGVQIALMEEKRLVELHADTKDTGYCVGDIYLGKVKKIISGLNAVFVDVGHEKDAFLHFLDLGPQVNSLKKFTKQSLSVKNGQLSMDNFPLEPDIEKSGKISSVLASGQQILVQIVKEPISTKGPRITTEIAFAGRYIVLVPFSDRISISQKIKDSAERNRLKKIMQSIKPKNFGVIIRTVAENRPVTDLDADLRSLINKWDKCISNLNSCEKAPELMLGELNKTSSILRDLLNDSFSNVQVNDAVLFDELKHYIATISPDKVDIVKLYKGKAPIFEHFGIDKQIKTSFGKAVTIKSGTYLVIEHTEALHVIDVNSGPRVNANNNQEGNACEVNLEAAVEVARQLRLRDMGGIIVIDFIDMHEGANRRKLYEKMKEAMKSDRAKHTILPPNKFGLVQITRQRVRPEVKVNTLEKCPVCDGTGEIKATITYIDEIERSIRYLIQDLNTSYIMLFVHPFIYAFLSQGIFSMRWKWVMKYKHWIRLKPMNSYHFLEYHFFDKSGEEIKF